MKADRDLHERVLYVLSKNLHRRHLTTSFISAISSSAKSRPMILCPFL